MQLAQVFDKLNQLEKNSFIKILDSIISESKDLDKKVQKILSSDFGTVKGADNEQIAQIFQLTRDKFILKVRQELSYRKQLDLIVDILIRDGNCIISRDWFSRLYEKQFKSLKGKLKEFVLNLDEDSKSFTEERKRDYTIFRNCVKTAYLNDEQINRDANITNDEQSILNSLSESLELSLEEIRLIRFSIVPLEKIDLDDIFKDLKEMGVLFYSKKTHTIYIPDEIVRVLREVRGFEVANKYYRRVLVQLKDSDINLICKKHNIDRKMEWADKIKEILKEGISFRNMLLNDIHKEGITKTQKKAEISEITEKRLGIEFKNKGVTALDRVNLLIDYFKQLDKEDRITISLDGYTLLLKDLGTTLGRLNRIVKTEFELEQENALDRELLIDYNIKPQDILDLLSKEDLLKFCQKQVIKSRGNLIQNILDAYQDSDNLLIENYVLISNRDQAGLKENGINIKESDLGIQFEEVTKNILIQLGFNVDEELRKQINTSKDKVDIAISLPDSDIIIVECKTKKDREFSKYSSVSRQIRSYFTQAEKAGYNVVKTLLVANDFTDEFIKGCELDFDINLSLLKAESLIQILEGFKESSLETFPYKLLFRDVLLDEKRIIRTLKK